MFCRKCGIKNEEGVTFCKNCGSSLTDTNVPTTPVINEANVINQSVDTNNVNTTTNNNKGGSKKKIIIIIVIAVVALIVIGILLKVLLGGKTSGNKVKLFEPNALIVVKKGDKYGYINTDGKFVLEAKYKYASSFVGDYAIVRVENPDKNDYHDEVYQLIDKKGNVKATGNYDSDIRYYSDENIWIINKQLYNEKIKKITSDNVEVSYDEGYLKWEAKDKKTAGIMNIKGKVTYTYKFASGENYFSLEVSDSSKELKQQYCRVNIENKKYGIVNCNTGKVIYDYTNNFIYDEDYNSFEISKKDSHEFIELIYIYDDKVVFKSTDKNSDVYGYTYKDGYIKFYEASVSDYSDRYSYLDLTTGKIVKDLDKITKKTDKADMANLNDFESVTKYTKFSCDKGYGIMSGDKVVIPCEWKQIEYLDLSIYNYLSSKGKKYILAEDDKSTVLLNLKNGKTVATFDSKYVKNNGGIFLKYDTKTDTIIYNLLTGKSKAFSKKADINPSSNYIMVKENGKYEYYNSDFKLIYTEER